MSDTYSGTVTKRQRLYIYLLSALAVVLVNRELMQHTPFVSPWWWFWEGWLAFAALPYFNSIGNLIRAWWARREAQRGDARYFVLEPPPRKV